MDVCSYTYRVLTAADGASWAALRREGARDFPLGFLITAEEADAMTLEKAQPILDQGMMRGVFDGSSLVGFCGFRRETLARTKHRAEIGPFFVTTAYQGRGAARTLMAGVINEAQVRGIEQLELFVDVGNHRALTFYERQGFKRISIHPDGVRTDGQVRDAYFCIIRPGEFVSASN